MASKRGFGVTRIVRKMEKERWNRDNWIMFVGVPWRKNDDDPNVDSERLKGDVVVLDRRLQRTPGKAEYVSVPKRVHITREDQERIGFTARCAGCVSFRGTAQLRVARR